MACEKDGKSCLRRVSLARIVLVVSVSKKEATITEKVQNDSCGFNCKMLMCAFGTCYCTDVQFVDPIKCTDACCAEVT